MKNTDSRDETFSPSKEIDSVHIKKKSPNYDEKKSKHYSFNQAFPFAIVDTTFQSKEEKK